MIGDEPACNQVRAFVRLQHDVRRAWHDFAVKRFAIKDDPAAALHRGSILAEDIVHRWQQRDRSSRPANSSHSSVAPIEKSAASLE
jgi:hypothetical protein